MFMNKICPIIMNGPCRQAQRGGLIDTQTHREKGIPKGALNTHKMHAETGVFNTHRKGVLTQKGSLHTDARGLMRTFTTRGQDDRKRAFAKATCQ